MGGGKNRGSLRLPVTLKVELFCQGRDLVGHSTDLSLTGMFIEMTVPPPLMAVAQLSFKMVGASGRFSVVAEGRVRRRIEPSDATKWRLPGAGFEFVRFHSGQEEFEQEVELRLDRMEAERARLVNSSHRSAPRVATGLPVLWGSKLPPKQEGALIYNLSSGGAFLATESPESVGTSIFLSFELPDHGEVKRVRMIAQVVRVVLGNAGGEVNGMGLLFGKTNLDLALLESFLRDRVDYKERATVATPEIRSQSPPVVEPKKVETSPQTMYREALWAHDQRRLAEAEGLLRQAMAVTPELAEAKGRLASVLIQREGRDAEAEREAAQASSEFPLSAECAEAMALVALKKGRIELASLYFQKAIVLDRGCVPTALEILPRLLGKPAWRSNPARFWLDCSGRIRFSSKAQ